MSRVCPKCGTVYSDEVFFCGHDGEITIEEQDPSDPDPRLGVQLGDYIVVARVADGAMGRVYEARHAQTKQRMAIKVLHEEVAQDEVSVERFKREYETANSLDHPHVVKVLDHGQTTDGSWYLTMEYLEGAELSNSLRKTGVQSLAQIVRVASQVAGALDHAHSFGVIHRDLKPDNIFLCQSDEGDVVKLLDFGSVKLQMEMGPKLTAFGTTLGSPYYMSPEQAMGKQDVDQRTDVFAVAAILYEMATGQVAFEGDNVAEILMKIVQHSPPPVSSLNPQLPSAFDDVVDKGLSKDKNGRYASVGDLAQAVVRSVGLTGSPDEWAQRSLSDIESAITNAEPPQPKPFDATSVPAGDAASDGRDSILESMGFSMAPGGGGGKKGLMVVGAVAVVGILVAAYFLFT